MTDFNNAVPAIPQEQLNDFQLKINCLGALVAKSGGIIEIDLVEANENLDSIYASGKTFFTLDFSEDGTKVILRFDPPPANLHYRDGVTYVKHKA
jgi:hypothetical protein